MGEPLFRQHRVESKDHRVVEILADLLIIFVVSAYESKDFRFGHKAGNYQMNIYGLVRTIRADFEEKTQLTTRVNHKVVAWILYHSSWLTNRYQILLLTTMHYNHKMNELSCCLCTSPNLKVGVL